MLKSIKEKLFPTPSNRKITASNIENVYALALLRDLMPTETYLPYSSSALSPLALATIANDVVINQRKSLLELGAGISTLVLARLIVKNKLNAHLTTIEDNADWLDLVRQMLEKEQLSQYVTLIHAPLQTPKSSLLPAQFWYDTQVLETHCKGKHYDMLVVDAPFAYDIPNQYNRYNALPFFAPYLAENCSIFLDDANRQGEQTILKTWNEQFGINFKTICHTFAFGVRGKYFNFEV